jgi:hypothetical protein
MAIEFTKQAEEMLKAAREARIPENVKVMAEQSVSQTRKAFDQLQSVTREHAAHTGSAMAVAQEHSKSIADKLLAHSSSNAEATFAAAMKIVQAPSLPEAARLQAEFVQSQFATASAQSQELFQLSSKAATTTMEQFQAAASKMFSTVGKTS